MHTELYFSSGQGYVWLAHKSPSIAAWPLSLRSNLLWNEFAKNLQDLGLDPQVIIGYKRTGQAPSTELVKHSAIILVSYVFSKNLFGFIGSLLFGTTSEHAFSLQKRAEALYAEGVNTEFLNSDDLRKIEPQLNVGEDGSAVLAHDDSQIDAHLAVAYFATVGTVSLLLCFLT